MGEERLEVLRMLEAGQIDAEEAVTLLAAVDVVQQETLRESAAPPPEPSEGPEQHWARFWIYPLMAGGIVLLLGALVMGLVYATDAARGWLVCGWLPMILGVVVIVLAGWSRRAKWLHLRISEGEQQKIAFSFPLPLTLAAWVLRIARPFVPQLEETGVDELIIALRDGTTGDEPFFIDVQDEEEGERVQVYIG
jgi:hypothetical protein